VIPRSVTLVVVALLATALLAACAAAPPFEPSGPCSGDGQQPGAYPELEALLPSTFEDRAPDRVDSGRSCTEASLANLARRGVEELRFAGALWELGERSGVTMAIFTAPGLEETWMAEFYEVGARNARKTENIQTGRLRVGDREAFRLDTLNAESFQTVVVWERREGEVVQAVLVGSFVREVQTREAHDRVVEQAVAMLNGG
jgi:hypothetical protein